jgi:hypothetical protein
LDGCFLHPLATLTVDEESVGGHHHAESFTAAIGGNLKDVGSQERLTSGENDNRAGKGHHIVKKFETLLGGKLVGIRLINRGCTTVYAAEVTGTGNLPGN